ncbi:MAG: sugar ABC transporter substrate-binding protein [Anaerolineae bacterium]|nr:sugar ABC transporter substrate-binding protein [Anaerolineae bacterium]
MSRKWFIALLTVSILALSAFSLVGVQAQGTCDGEEITLRLDDWSSGDRVEYMNQVLDAFMQEYPCVKVVAEPNIGDDQNTRRLTMIASGTAPDLVATGESWIPLYAEAGGFMDLTPFVTGPEGFDPAAIFYEGVYNQGFYKGNPVAIAKDYSVNSFYVNKALFDAAGISLPEEGWTYDDYLDIAMQMTLDADGNNATSPDFNPDNIVQWGTDIIDDGWWRGYQSFLYSWGAHTISDDGTTTAGYLNSDAAVTAWEWYRDQVHVHHVAPSGTLIGGTEGGRVQMFQDGKIAIGVTFHGPWWQDVFNETPNLDWGVVPIPTGPAGHHSAVMWMGWGINAKTEHPNEAWELLKWLTTEPGQRVFALKALSADRAVSEELQRVDDPYWGVYVAEAQYLDQLDEQLNAYYGPCVFTPAGDLLKRVLADGGDMIDIKAELDTLAQSADACLAESTASGASS